VLVEAVSESGAVEGNIEPRSGASTEGIGGHNIVWGGRGMGWMLVPHSLGAPTTVTMNSWRIKNTHSSPIKFWQNQSFNVVSLESRFIHKDEAIEEKEQEATELADILLYWPHFCWLHSYRYLREITKPS